QEHLPGAEYSVDAVAGAGGRVLAAVPRERLKIDSGIAVAARSLRDDDLERHATGLTEALGLRFTANVQFKRDAAGVPKLLEINPRFPGTMPLTVRSGVDIPALCLDKVLGWPLPRRPLSFEPTVMVRHWRETWPEALVGEGAADTGPEFRPRRAAAG
ncbi:MAG: ATP-grasp domain-containing protein, partial [Acidobacteriota bacterium]